MRNRMNREPIAVAFPPMTSWIVNFALTISVIAKRKNIIDKRLRNGNLCIRCVCSRSEKNMEGNALGVFVEDSDVVLINID